jgi:hypothetical protein
MKRRVKIPRRKNGVWSPGFTEMRLALIELQGMGAEGERNTKATAMWDWMGFPS